MGKARILLSSLCGYLDVLIKILFGGSVFLFLVVCLFLCTSCRESKPTPAQIDFLQVPYPRLSEYGFFQRPLKDLVPAERVLAYRPASALFSDHALKSRFVWMPDDSSATISEQVPYAFEFPDGAVLIKNFYYEHAGSPSKKTRRIIETRLLIKLKGTWQAYPYLWNKEQTEATYKITGADIPVQFTDDHGQQWEISYIVPNKNQCKSCHNQNEALLPIGTKARNLNFTFDYGNALINNQLEQWKAAGYLRYPAEKNYPAMVDYEQRSADPDRRARAYLDINCAHCHSEEGPASTSGLLLGYEEEDRQKLGVFKTPVAAGIGTGPHTYNIVPGRADESILCYRMNSTQPGIAMPEIGRVTIHEEGLELIKDWINNMK